MHALSLDKDNCLVITGLSLDLKLKLHKVYKKYVHSAKMAQA